MTRIVLASASPRRHELLQSLGWEVDVRPTDVDETPRAEESPRDYVVRLAVDKCRAAFADADEVVIAADTTIDIPARAGREIVGKPRDAADARRMLRGLSGRTHRVHTGVAVRRGEALAPGVVTTHVRMSSLTDETIHWYVATGEPLDKAGAYAIQGVGGALVESVRGSVSNVIGLPLAEVLDLVRQVGAG